MTGELWIAAGPGEWHAALVEGGVAVELFVERGDTLPPGSIHLGRVVRIVAGLDAALVDIGEARPGFLPLRDLPPGVTAQEGMRIVVRIRREATRDKPSRLSARPAIDPATLDRAAGHQPPAQLAPLPGLAPALRLRLATPPPRVVTDDPGLVPELRAAFVESEVVHRAAADWPLDLDAVLAEALAPQVALSGGGMLHIEEARAATLIDVDSGPPQAAAPARAALAANLAAARRIAREVRLRNIGGGIVVDFVGLPEGRAGHGARERLRQALADALVADPAQPQLLGWTRLGHIEIVRPRRGRSLAEAMLQAGSPVRQPIAAAGDALRRLQREARAQPAVRWRLTVSPVVAAALRGPAAAALRGLEARLGRAIALDVDPALPPDGFDIAPQ